MTSDASATDCVRSTVVAADDHRILVDSWIAQKPRGIVLIFHGLAEHAARYERFAIECNNAGFHHPSLRGPAQVDNTLPCLSERLASFLQTLAPVTNHFSWDLGAGGPGNANGNQIEPPGGHRPRARDRGIRRRVRSVSYPPAHPTGQIAAPTTA